ncbi:MAG: helix-turn-helix domain-containing protein [Marinicella sp.]
MQENLKLLRPKAVCELLSISPATLWRLTRDNKLNPPIKLGGRSVAFPESEILDFVEKRKAEREQ